MAYYPSERGSYNYTTNLNPDGSLKTPQGNWGGITRAITNNIDFDAANIQYIEFWMLSPYATTVANQQNYLIEPGVPFNPSNTGQLYFNLGSISEDVLPDNLQSFENGLPVSGNSTLISTTTTNSTWGRISNQQFLTNAFDNTTPGSRAFQDIGLDGLDDADEQTFFHTYDSLIRISTSLTQAAKSNILSDISGDNFSYYLGATQDAEELTVLQRYKNYNHVQNNSPINNGAAITPSSTSYPDNEDINADNTVNTVEAYYEYKVNIDPKKMTVGQNYIVSQRPATVQLPNGTNTDVTWYQFRIPIRSPDSTIGSIEGYKSIKWMRTYMSGFSSPVVLR
ncbi:MAG TPA: cell surface protein SprA, partial [Bacteroidia bacterium]|nr:cell surface protein SprA [Bacteroidia bacterium]